MKYSRIIGTGSYLPSKTLTNEDLEKIVDTSDEWIVERTGIKSRHVMGPDETTVTMAHTAAKKAIEASGIDKNEIEQNQLLGQMANHDFYKKDKATIIQAQTQLSNLENELKILYKRWEFLDNQ